MKRDYCVQLAVTLCVFSLQPLVSLAGSTEIPPAWTEKYEGGEGKRVLYCDGSVDRYPGGAWDEWSVTAMRWTAHDEPIDAGCVMRKGTGSGYIFCDEDAKDLSICEGSSPNATYFAEMGYTGQDCTSWRYLSLLYVGDIDVGKVSRRCLSDCSDMPGCVMPP